MTSHHLQRQGSVDHDDSPPCSRSSTSSLTQTMTSSSGCDVVKKGSLYVKKFPNRRAVSISIKTWHKRYLVLRDDWTHSGKTTLDIYDRESDSADAPCPSPTPTHTHSPSLFFSSSSFSSYPSPPLTIDLRSVVSVDLYLESRSFVHALVVDRSDGFPVILGAETDHEMRCWLAAIRLLADKANRLVVPGDLLLLGDGRSLPPPSCPSASSASVSSEDDVKMPRKGSQSLKAKLNRKTPQLFKFARGPTTTRHLSIDRELSPKPFGSKWFSSSLSSRKDSGFSESFDESVDQFQSTYFPPQVITVEEDDDDDDYVNNGPSTPPPPPIPPRASAGSPFATSPRSPLFPEPWFASEAPLPPPRPRHTLSVTSW